MATYNKLVHPESRFRQHDSPAGLMSSTEGPSFPHQQSVPFCKPAYLYSWNWQISMHTSWVLAEKMACMPERRPLENSTQSPFQLMRVFRQWQQSFFPSLCPQSSSFSPEERLKVDPRCWKSNGIEKSTHLPWFPHLLEHPLSTQLPPYTSSLSEDST